METGTKLKVEEGIKGSQLVNEEDDGWERAHKRPAKRPLPLTDTTQQVEHGNQRELGSSSGKAHESYKNAVRDGRSYRRDGHKSRARDTQLRGSNQGDNGYRGRGSRVNQGGRGRGWPAPLYQPRNEATGNPRRAMNHGVPIVTPSMTLDKNKGKEQEKPGEGEPHSDINVVNGDTMVEEGELGLEDYDIEGQGRLLEELTGQENTYLGEEEGMLPSLLPLAKEIESISKQIDKGPEVVSVDVGAGIRTPKVLRGISSRKRNLVLLVSPRKTIGSKILSSKQVTKETQQGTIRSSGEPMRKMEHTGRSTRNMTTGKVVIPKPPART